MNTVFVPETIARPSCPPPLAPRPPPLAPQEQQQRELDRLAAEERERALRQLEQQVTPSHALLRHSGGGGDSGGPTTPPQGASGRHLVAKGTGLLESTGTEGAHFVSGTREGRGYVATCEPRI